MDTEGITKRITFPKWLQTILSMLAVFCTVFFGSWGGLRAFESSMIAQINVVSTRMDQFESSRTELRLADQHALDIIEMNRQVRIEQLNAINDKLDGVKNILEDLLLSSRTHTN